MVITSSHDHNRNYDYNQKMNRDMDDLQTELRVLQSHIDSLVGCIKKNEIKLHRFQLLEKNLLTLNSLHELVEHVLNDTQTVFDLDFVSFCLVDEKGEIKRFLEESGLCKEECPGLVLLSKTQPLEKLFGKAGRPYLGNFNQKKCAYFFPESGEKTPASVAIMPLIRRGRYLGSLALGSLDEARFSMQMATDFLGRLADILSVCLENTLNFEMLKRTSFMDPLTGINNRRFFDQRIIEEIDRVRRNGDPLSCLFLDIDFFKKINDTYGHQAGDYVLSETAGQIRGQLRSNDVLARYGGEEFIVLLAGAHEKKAMEVAERIRSATEAKRFDCISDSQKKITISIGISVYLPSEFGGGAQVVKPSQLIERADKALYRAKMAGRNQVVSDGVLLMGNKKVSNG